jgi:hypothetical protein
LAPGQADPARVDLDDGLIEDGRHHLSGQAAGHWTTPRMSQGYQVEIPLRIFGANVRAR